MEWWSLTREECARLSLIPNESERVERQELWARLADPALRLVNVQSQEAFDACHVPGSLSLPVADITSRAPRLLPDRNAEIIVYCGSFT